MSTEITKTHSPEQERELTATRPERYIRPGYEVIPSENSYEVRVRMPGVGKDGLNLTLDKNDLLIEGTRTDRRKPSWKAVHREISEANYRLRLQLNVAVNDAKISAKMENGILRVSLPIAEEAKPKTIAIE